MIHLNLFQIQVDPEQNHPDPKKDHLILEINDMNMGMNDMIGESVQMDLEEDDMDI